jgi:uncharacterized protein
MLSKLHITYNQVHNNLREIAPKIKSKFDPEVIVAIGGGGHIPARIIRTWINVPILSVCVQLYGPDDKIHKDGPREFQWLDDKARKWVRGKRILLVDEVDDTRTTLSYCVNELKRAQVSEIAVLVLHNKLKKKALLDVSHYFACTETDGSQWIVYPWEVDSISEHDKLAEK